MKKLICLMTVVFAIVLSTQAFAGNVTDKNAILDGKEHIYDLDGANDQVYLFHFELKSQGQLNLKLSNKSEGTLSMSLYDNERNLMSGSYLGQSASTTSPYVVKQSLAPGLYYVSLSNYSRYRGNFGISFSFLDYGVPYQPNDTFMNPIRTINADETIVGAVSFQNSSDFYKISIPSDKTKVNIACTGLTDGEIKFELKKSDSETSSNITESGNLNNNKTESKDVELNKGSYILQISSSGRYCKGGKYSVKYTIQTPTTPQTPANQQTTPAKQTSTPKVGTTTTINNITYKITNNTTKSVTVTKIVNKKTTTVTIPTTVKINNTTYNVTNIANNYISKNNKVKKVVINANITNIGTKAFFKCKKLKVIWIRSMNLKSIGKGAFKNIYKKAVIYVPKSKYKFYKKLLKKSGLGKKVKIKTY